MSERPPPDPRTSVVVASVSGGKDSAALSLWLTEQGIEHRRVFADTGWEHASTYEHLAYLDTVLGPIDRVQSKHGGMADLLRKRGMFPSRTRRFCTQELKARPITRYLAEHSCDVNAIGIRAGESLARSKMPEWEWSNDFDCHTWRPLIAWTEDDVIAIHQRHGVRPAPLYLQGASRVGCWPCIFSRKSEIKLIADIDPARIDEIEALEAEVTATACERAAAKGTSMEERGHHSPTFFHVKSIAAHVDAAGRRLTPAELADVDSDGKPQASAGTVSLNEGGMVPIREMVDWSRTSRGGRQLTMLDDPPGGCMRWGLCEHEDP